MIWKKFFPFFIVPKLWNNHHINHCGIYDDKGTVFSIHEEKRGNCSSFHFVPFLQKSSFLQKFSYTNDVMLFEFFHKRTEQHFVDIIQKNGNMFRIELNDTTVFQEIDNKTYRRINYFGSVLICDINTKICKNIDSNLRNNIYLLHVKCINDLQFSIDSYNHLVIKNFKDSKILFKVRIQRPVNMFHVEKGSHNMYYVFTKDEYNYLTIYTFQYENHNMNYKDKTNILLPECLDIYIQYPYFFVMLNEKHVNIYHVQMLQSKYFLKPPNGITKDYKMLLFNKKLLFYTDKKYMNVPFCCLKHFLK